MGEIGGLNAFQLCNKQRAIGQTENINNTLCRVWFRQNVYT